MRREHCKQARKARLPINDPLTSTKLAAAVAASAAPSNAAPTDAGAAAQVQVGRKAGR